MCDIGAGTVDLVWRGESVTGAGGGDIVTLAVASALNISSGLAERVKRSASVRVENPHVVHEEDGRRVSFLPWLPIAPLVACACVKTECWSTSATGSHPKSGGVFDWRSSSRPWERTLRGVFQRSQRRLLHSSSRGAEPSTTNSCAALAKICALEESWLGERTSRGDSGPGTLSHGVLCSARLPRAAPRSEIRRGSLAGSGDLICNFE